MLAFPRLSPRRFGASFFASAYLMLAILPCQPASGVSVGDWFSLVPVSTKQVASAKLVMKSPCPCQCEKNLPGASAGHELGKALVRGEVASEPMRLETDVTELQPMQSEPPPDRIDRVPIHSFA